MRNLILGGIGVVWGLGVILYSFLSGERDPGGAYGLGMIIGQVFGWLLFLVGGFFFVMGALEVRANYQYKHGGRRRPKKRKRRPQSSGRLPPGKRTATVEGEGFEDELDEGPEPFRISPYVWIAGGTGLAALVLIALVAGGVYLIVSAGSARLPPQAEKAKQDLARTYGADKVFTVELRGLTDAPHERKWASDRMGEIARSLSQGPFTASTTDIPKGMVIAFGGLNDMKAMADQIDFGKVETKTRARHLVVEVDLPQLRQMAAAKGWNQPGQGLAASPPRKDGLNPGSQGQSPTGAAGRASDSPDPPAATNIFATKPRVFLSDLQEFGAKHGPWPVTKGGRVGNPIGDAIMVNGKPSPKGIGMHPPDGPGFALVKYRLGKQAAVLKATVAINDSGTRPVSHVVFTVLGDGKELFRSGAIGNTQRSQDCSVDVSGVDILELRVTAGGFHFDLHAVWVEPRLLKTATTPDQ